MMPKKNMSLGRAMAKTNPTATIFDTEAPDAAPETPELQEDSLEARVAKLEQKIAELQGTPKADNSAEPFIEG